MPSDSKPAPPRLEDLLDQAIAEAETPDVSDPPEPEKAAPEAEAGAPEAEDYTAALDDAIGDAPWAKSDEDLMREAMEQQMVEDQLRGAAQLRRGDKVTGTVVHVTESDIFVDIGGKAEALLESSEMRNEDGEVQVHQGDTLTLYVAETRGETVRLSYKMALEARSREAVREAYAEHMALEGRITSKRKGGFEVRFKSGQRAFLPLSQVDLHHVPDELLDEYVGKSYQFLITKYESDGRDLVVSRSQLLREERAQMREEVRSTIQEGQVREGTVSRIVDFGIFVDLGGLDGLVHISEIQWGHTERPQDRFAPGDVVRIKVLRVDHAKGTVGLSIKQVEGSPWDKVGEEFVEGGIYPGTVVRLEAFGAFVELIPGLEGLVHVSEISWERIKHPEVVVQKRDKVTVKLIRVELDRQRLGLSIKQVGGDPWKDIAAGWMRGQLLEGEVDKVAPFGVFVRVAPGISGLIPMSNLGMDQSAARMAYQAGKKVTVEVDDVDMGRRRIRLLPSDEKARGERAALEDYSRSKDQEGLGTLADLLGNLKIDR